MCIYNLSVVLLRLLEPGSFSLSSGGDQILVFSGSEAAPDYMCALNFEGNGWQSTADSSSSSALPPGLTHMALAEVAAGTAHLAPTRRCYRCLAPNCHRFVFQV